MKSIADPVDQELKLREVLEVLDPDQLLNIVQKLRGVMELKHGEIILVIKNGELAFVDVRLSEDVRNKRVN